MIVGILIVVVGLAWPWLTKLPIGRLPGDLRFGGEDWTVSIPLATCLIVSAIVTVVVLLLRR